MSLTSLLNRACTITHRAWDGTLDSYGNQVATPTDTVTVCELQQKQRDETPGQVSGSSWLLILPAGTTIAPGDTVTVDLEEVEVQGEPGEARNPRTQVVSHIEATLARAVSTQEAADAA